MCSNCSNNPCTCGYIPQQGNCCNKSKTDNIKYSGPDLPCSGISINDDLTTIIQILSTLACGGGSTTTSTTTVQNCFVWEAMLTNNGSNQPPTVQVINSNFGEAMVVSVYDADADVLVIHLLGAIPDMDETTMVLFGNNSPKSYTTSVNTITFDSALETTGIIVKHCNTLPSTPVSYGYMFVGPASGPDPCFIIFPPTPILLYSTKPNSSDLIVGDILYMDQELSTPYTGAGSEYIMQYSTGIAYTLDNAGAIDSVILC